MKKLITLFKESRFARNIGIFLAIMGPGIITANVDNDAGGIATYSLAGAHFGYTLFVVASSDYTCVGYSPGDVCAYGCCNR